MKQREIDMLTGALCMLSESIKDVFFDDSMEPAGIVVIVKHGARRLDLADIECRFNIVLDVYDEAQFHDMQDVTQRAVLRLPRLPIA